MSHYDCRSCGASFGIDFGYCESCTPKEYFEIKTALNKIYKEAEYTFNDKVYHLKKQFINSFRKEEVLKLQERMKELEQKGPI